MYARLTLLPFLMLALAFQTPLDAIQKHYQAAQDFHQAGRAAEAESEYRAALAAAYASLGKVLLAGGEYRKALVALERAGGAEAARLDLATAYFHAAQYDKAIAPLQAALAKNPRDPAAHHLLGKVYFMTRQFDRAAAELETASKLAPADFDILYTLALAHLKQQRLAPARAIFTRMLGRLGSRPEVHNLFGRAYRETRHYDQAITEFKKAIALNPKYPRAHYNLGLAYLLKDGALKLKEAGDEFRAELALNPDEFLAVYNLGLVRVVERRYEEAITLLEKAARLRPQNPDVRLFLGNAYHGAGQFEKAIESLRLAMQLNPRLDQTSAHAAEAHFLLGQSLVRVGRLDEAEKELEIARELKVKALSNDREKIVAYLSAEEFRPEQFAPGGEANFSAAVSIPEARGGDQRVKEAEQLLRGVVARIHNQTGLFYAERQEMETAADHFRSAVEWDAGLRGAHYNLGLAYYRLERHRDAIAPLAEAVKTDAADIASRHLLGMCYFMTEDYAAAVPLLREALAASPDNVALQYTLSLSLIKTGHIEEANRMTQRMLALHGDSAQARVLLGQAYHAQNEDARALDELRKATEMDPRLPMAHFYAGLIYIKLGNLTEAARQFEAELAVNPKDQQAKFHLGVVLLSGGDGERGLALMREVVAARPDFADARFELGKALLQRGEVAQAVESLEMAARLGPDKPHIHYQLGRAYTAAGREADAQKSFDTFKQLKDKERNRNNASSSR